MNKDLENIKTLLIENSNIEASGNRLKKLFENNNTFNKNYSARVDKLIANFNSNTSKQNNGTVTQETFKVENNILIENFIIIIEELIKEKVSYSHILLDNFYTLIIDFFKSPQNLNLLNSEKQYIVTSFLEILNRASISSNYHKFINESDEGKNFNELLKKNYNNLSINLNSIYAVGKDFNDIKSEEKLRNYEISINYCIYNIIFFFNNLLLSVAINYFYSINKNNQIKNDLYSIFFQDLKFDKWKIADLLTILKKLIQIFEFINKECTLPNNNVARNAPALNDIIADISRINFDELLVLLEKINIDINDINSTLQSNESENYIIELEETFGKILLQFYPLASYSLISLNGININQFWKNHEINYIHKYWENLSYGLDKDRKIYYGSDCYATESVLFCKNGNLDQHLNLYPFVIDAGTIGLIKKSYILYLDKVFFDHQTNLDKVRFSDSLNLTLSGYMIDEFIGEGQEEKLVQNFINKRLQIVFQCINNPNQNTSDNIIYRRIERFNQLFNDVKSIINNLKPIPNAP